MVNSTAGRNRASASSKASSKAGAKVGAKASTKAGNGAARPRAERMRDTEALVHELEVHQVELEMQNEELRRAQLDLAAARDLFVDLYDFAPVGYFTLDQDGAVVGANLTGAALLGRERKSLLGRRFAQFVAPADSDRWQRQWPQALQHEDSQRIELALLRSDGTTFDAQLDCLRFVPPGVAPVLRVTLTDVTQRRQAEMDRRITANVMQARESERRRVARELHEELGQRLSALKMDLTSLVSGLDAPHRKDQVVAMLESLDGAVATVRRIAAELRPLMLDDLGLNAAIDWLARDTGRRLGISVDLRLDESDPPLDERASVEIYRMVQETLACIALHTRCTGVRIEMQPHAGELVLTVQCEGVPPGTPATADGWSDASIGLRDRAYLLGGEVSIEQLPQRGPRIAVRVPLRRSGDPHPLDTARNPA